VNHQSKSFIAAPDVLAARSDYAGIGWSYGEANAGSQAGEDELAGCLVRTSFHRSPGEESARDGLEQFHYWQGDVSGQVLHYERPWFASSRLRLRVTGLGTNDLAFHATPNYLRSIRFRFNNLHSVGYLATDAVAATLLKIGWAPIHCAAVAVDEHAILLVAAPNSGKTLTSLLLTRNAGAEFIAEDLAFTDGTSISGCSLTSTFRYYDEFMTRRDRTMNRAIAVLPPVELLRGKAPRKIHNVLPDSLVAGVSRPISHVFFLERKDGADETISAAEATDRLLRFNRYEFKHLTSPMIAAANYFWDAFPQEQLVSSEAAIARKLVSSVPVRVIRESDPRRFSDAILTNIDS
jgi:hypothetical protein